MFGSFLAGAKATIRRAGASDLSSPPSTSNSSSSGDASSMLNPTTTDNSPDVAERCEERTAKSRIAGGSRDGQQLRGDEESGDCVAEASPVSVSSSFSRFRASSARVSRSSMLMYTAVVLYLPYLCL